MDINSGAPGDRKATTSLFVLKLKKDQNGESRSCFARLAQSDLLTKLQNYATEERINMGDDENSGDERSKKGVLKDRKFIFRIATIEIATNQPTLKLIV